MERQGCGGLGARLAAAHVMWLASEGIGWTSACSDGRPAEEELAQQREWVTASANSCGLPPTTLHRRSPRLGIIPRRQRESNNGLHQSQGSPREPANSSKCSAGQLQGCARDGRRNVHPLALPTASVALRAKTYTLDLTRISTSSVVGVVVGARRLHVAPLLVDSHKSYVETPLRSSPNHVSQMKSAEVHFHVGPRMSGGLTSVSKI
jgi:hypothetical protein